MAQIQTFELTPFATNCFVLKDRKEALVVDPGDVSSALLKALDGCAVQAIVNTHGHCDHCGGNAPLVKHTGAKLMCHAADVPLLRTVSAQGEMFGVPFSPSPEPDRQLDDGDELRVGSLVLRVLHTPGHSPGHICLLGDKFVFSGDLLFAGSVGRTDLPGGDYRQLLESIRAKLLPLPDDTLVYSGHGPVTDIGAERRTNPFLAGMRVKI